MTSLKLIEVRVPEIGDFHDIPVIEILVQPGALISQDDPIVTLESDKATLDVPAPIAGRVASIEVAPGTRVSRGSLLLRMESGGLSLASDAAKISPPAAVTPTVNASPLGTPVRRSANSAPYASPSVRRMARELGVDLTVITGSGPRGRIIKTDLLERVRAQMQLSETPARRSEAVAPVIDFAKFGPIERQPQKRVSRISAQVLSRNWTTIPHVTNFEDADVTALDELRKSINPQREGLEEGVKVTLTAFVIKAMATALTRVPALNVSLDADDLVVKQYIHIGVAVDSESGLRVPVLRDVDKSGVLSIASQLSEKAKAAHAGKLRPEDMQGGSMTVSSLGGIGSRHFTPLINAPEVAIVGLGKTRIEPRWDGERFLPRLILPVSLSWDHRALDGATAARFLTQLIGLLEDFRRVGL